MLKYRHLLVGLAGAVVFVSTAACSGAPSSLVSQATATSSEAQPAESIYSFETACCFAWNTEAYHWAPGKPYQSNDLSRFPWLLGAEPDRDGNQLIWHLDAAGAPYLGVETYLTPKADGSGNTPRNYHLVFEPGTWNGREVINLVATRYNDTDPDEVSVVSNADHSINDAHS